MTLFDVIRDKGAVVHTIQPWASLQEVSEKLARYDIGALVVCERNEAQEDRVVGIITERDLIRFTATRRAGSFAERRVVEVMTTRVITGAPTDSLEAAMELMTSNRIRHLPVLAEGRLVGMVSIGDLVKAQLDLLAMENQFMKDYIQH